MKKENCVSPIISHPQEWGLSFLMRRLLLALSLFVLVGQTAAVVAGQEEVPANLPELTPAAVISFDYPKANPWILNSLAVLTPDGRYLIDAAGRARYLQVWDWKKNKVVKRLLLNENAPEIETKADMRDEELGTLGEPGWAFSPDGKYFAVCTQLNRMVVADKIIARVWDIEQGTVVANIKAMLSNKTLPPNVSSQGEQDAVVWQSCNSLSFRSDGKQLAVSGGEGSFYANRERFATWKKDGKIYSTLYDTSTWQPTAALRNPDILEDAVSPGLYDRADGKTIFMLLKQRPGFIIAEKLGIKGIPTPEQSDPYVKKRLVAFDANTGQIVKSLDLPQMKLRMLGGDSAQGIKWSWLGESSKEVYWNLGHQFTLGQTDEEYLHCDKNEVTPDIYSEVIADCAHLWRDVVFDIVTGKTRFMTPVKKIHDSYDKWKIVSANSRISPDGKHLLLSTMRTHVSSKTDGKGARTHKSELKMAICSYPSLRLIATLKSPQGAGIPHVRFDGNSRHIILSGGYREATIYDLSKISQAQ